MKFFISLALLALAQADQVRVVYPEAPSPLLSRPSMGQYIVPNYVIDAIKVAASVPMDVADDRHDGFKVQFVDAPLAAPSDFVAVVEPELSAPESVVVVETSEFSAPQPITLGEAPAPAFETADAVKFADGPAVEAVRIAEPKMPEQVIAEDISPVKIAEAPLPAIETEVDAVRFADAPLEIPVPEPVRIAEAPLPVQESAPEAVKIAVPEFRDYRGKIFDDPLLR